MDEGVTFGRGMPPVLLGGRVFVDGVGAGAAEDAGVGADEGGEGDGAVLEGDGAVW